jgi:hypothetical protein
MITFSAGITFLFYRTLLWKNIFIKDIALWILFVGTPLFFGAINRKPEEHYFKEMLINNFKLTVLIEFFISSFTFELIWEIMLVPILVFIFMLDAITSTKNEYRPTKKLMSTIIVIINIIFIYETVSMATGKLSSLNLIDSLISLLIPIVFSVFYIPISYMFAIFCKYQIIFIRMGFKESKDNYIKILHRFKIIWLCKLSLSKLDKFERFYIQSMYMNMDEVEFDKVLQQFRSDSAKESSSNNQYTKEERKLINHIKEGAFLKRIEYINAHTGFFTLLFTLIIGLTSILLKGFFYVFTCGKFDYWGISHVNINPFNENMLYEILLFAAGSIIYIAFNFIPFTILTSEKSWHKKLFKIIILLTCTTIALSVSFLVNEITVNQSFIVNSQSIIQLVIISMILAVIGYIPGLMMPISFRPHNDKSENGSNILLHKLLSFSTLSILIFGISIYVIMAYWYGRSLAGNKKSFKIIDNNYAVIYEDMEYFIVSDYYVTTDNTLIIDPTTQMLIKKENKKTRIRSFDQVIRGTDK